MDELLKSKHFFLFVLVVTTLCEVNSCPSHCLCNFQNTTSVLCVGSVPSASALPQDVEILSIKGSYTGAINFRHLRKQDLQGLDQLTSLTISHSTLNMIDVDAFSELKLLRHLDLSYNQLKRINRGTLQNIDSLNKLDLSGNAGFMLDYDTLQGLTSLREIYLSNTEMATTSSLFFNGAPYLQTLDLSDNQLTSIPEDFKDFRNLKDLDISFNSLKELSDQLESFVKGLSVLKLSDNPWHCSCVIRWLKHTIHAFSQHGHLTLACQSPDELQYQTLALIPDSKLVCIPPDIKCDTPLPVFEDDLLQIRCEVFGDPFPDVKYVW